MNSVNTIFSKKMRTISFVSALLVMFIHAYNIAVYDVQSEIIYWLEEVISQCIARLAVPFFFMQSAFFLYREKGKNVLEVYKTRVKSVLIPYLLWNIIYMLMFTLLKHMSLSNFGMDKITVRNIIKGIFLYEYNYSYWFMYYLLIFIMLYPVIRYIIGRSKVIAIGIVGVLFLLYWNGYPFLESAIYYYIGALLGYYFDEQIQNTVFMTGKQRGILNSILGIAAISLFFVVNVLQFQEMSLIRNIVMVALFFGLINGDIGIKPIFLEMSFMLYSLHPLVLEAIEKLIYIFLSHNNVFAVVDYFIAPMITMGMVFGVAILMKKAAPWLYKCLNGQRR